jgi:hypothetical protein
MARGGKWLLAAGVIAFLLVIVANVPASLVGRWLPTGLTVGTLSGTVWHGEAQSMRAAGIDVERLTWRLQPLALIGGRISAHVDVVNRTDRAAADITIGRGGRVAARALDADFDAAAIAGRALPAGWAGPIRVRLDDIVIERGWITAISGTAESGSLTGPSNVQPYLGSYHLEFGRDATTNPNELLGHFHDLGGPIEISGTIRLSRDRRAVLSGWVRARPGAAPEVRSDIESKLLQSDPQGRRLFSVENNF